MAGSDFFMQIEAEMKGAVGAASELGDLGDAITAAKASYAGFERTSLSTGKSLEAVGGKIAALRAKMEKSMAAGDMKSFWRDGGKLNALVDQESKLKVKADAAKAALAGQSAELAKMSQQYGKLKTAQDKAAKSLKDAEASAKGFQKSGDGLEKFGGPLGRLGGAAKGLSEGWGDLKNNLGTTGAAAAVGVVGLVAITAALVAGAAAAGMWALKMANAGRDTALTVEAMAGGSEAGKKLSAEFSSITDSTGIASDRLIALSRDLKKAKVSADDMPTALKALALQEQALGDSSGTADLIKQLETGQKSASKLGSEMETQFGGVVAKKMLGLDQQAVRFQNHLAGLFKNQPPEEFLAGLSKIVDLFSSSGAAGQALKAIMGSMFGDIQWDGVFVKVEAFFLGMTIGAQRVYLAVLKVSNALGLSEIGKGWGDFASASSLGSAAAYALLAPIVAIGAAAALAAKHIETMGKAGALLKDLAAKIDGKPMASAGADGSDAKVDYSESGVTAGKAYAMALIAASPAAYSAGKLLGLAGHKGLKDGQEERSPPRLFLQSGAAAADAYTAGIEDGTPAANDAAMSLVKIPSTPEVTATSKAASGGAQVSITLQFNIQSSPGEDNEALAQRVAELVQDELEGLALKAGAAVAA